MTAVNGDVSRETPAIDWERVDADKYARAELYQRDSTELADKIMELHAELEATKAALAASFVPVKLRWSLVRSGDVIVSKTGALLPVMEVAEPEEIEPDVTLRQFRIVEDGVNRWLKSTDPDRPVPVLVREREAFALKLLRGELNITVMDRKSGSS